MAGSYMRRNYKQEEAMSRIEEIEVLIKSTMLVGQISEQERNQRLSELLKERDETQKSLRDLQMNQARCQRYRARKSSTSSSSSSTTKKETSPQQLISDRDFTYFSGGGSVDDTSSIQSGDLLNSWDLTRIAASTEWQFLDDLERNMEFQTEDVTLMLIAMRKEHIQKKCL
jgi:hypothetical protein